LNFFCFSCASA
ncbi:hypothetical protein BAE44_0004706, partial [Dichanthelium oligosanthes]